MTQLENRVLGAGFVAMTEDELYAVNGGAAKKESGSGCRYDFEKGEGCLPRHDDVLKTSKKWIVGPTTGPDGRPGISIKINF